MEKLVYIFNVNYDWMDQTDVIRCVGCLKLGFYIIKLNEKKKNFLLFIIRLEFHLPVLTTDIVVKERCGS